MAESEKVLYLPIRPDPNLQKPQEEPISTGDSGGDGVLLGERMAKLEGAMEGLKSAMDGLRHSQVMLMAVTGLGFTLVAGVMGYLATRIDNLPGELRGIADSISQAVTASKQAPPQVILMPAPALPQEPPKAK